MLGQPPLTVGEQGLALALAGATPTRARDDFGDSPQSQLAWVVACSWFLRKTRPHNPRRSAAPLYTALDRLARIDIGPPPRVSITAHNAQIAVGANQ